MLIAYLAKTGGKVVTPNAVALVEGENRDHVSFVDAAGTVLVTSNVAT